MVMFVALHTASLVDPTLARDEALAVPRALHATIARQLQRARLRAGTKTEMEAAILAALVPSLAQAVLDRMQTPKDAIAIIEHAIDRALR